MDKVGKEKIMSSLMEYKGYHAKIEFSAEDGTFVGRILGINDVIAFDGNTVSELEAMFHESVDDYLEMCAEFGREPDKEYKGTFNVRIAPELHRRAFIESEARNVSLNQFIQQSIENELSGGHVKEVITIVMPTKEMGNYSPASIGVGFYSDNFGRKEALESWQQTAKFAYSAS